MAFAPTYNPALSLSNLQTASQGCAYIASSGLQTISGTSETPFLYVKNASTNQVSFASFLMKFINTTASHTAAFNFYWNPTISSNGTAVIINNLRNNSATLPSKMNVYYAPSASSKGVKISTLEAGNTENLSQLPLIVDAGYSLLVTVTVSNSSDVVLGELNWFEINL